MRGAERERIAIIAGQLDVGGSERQLYFWLSHMDRDRFEPIVVTLNPSRGDYWEKPIESLGVPLLREDHRHNPLVRLVNLVQALRSFRPHLIHGWNLFTSPYAGAVAKLLGSKSIGSLRDNLRVFNAHPYEATLTQYLVDALVVNSQAAARELASAGKCRRQKVCVVPNAVETFPHDRMSLRERIGARFALPQDHLWIGAMGRFVPKKRFDVILNVLASVQKNVPNVCILFIGDGPLRAELTREASSLGLDGVLTFTGEDADAHTWLGALDIFCFAGLDEGLPNVVMEAAVAGVPVVALRTASLEELLEANDSALLVVPGDLRGMEEAILSLARDQSLRRRIGDAAQCRVSSRFSLAAFVSQMSAAYMEVLDITLEPPRRRP